MSAKKLFKRFISGLALLLISPLTLLYWGLCLVFSRSRVFPAFSQALSLIPGISGQYIRWAFYSLTLQECGADICICFGVLISHPATRIGRLTYVGPFSMLGEVTLGDDCLIGSHVSIINGNHQHGIDRLDIPVREQVGENPLISIGEDSWVGDRAIVMANVGQHCVVGAGSVVTRDLPDYAIAVGCPAKVISYRNGRKEAIAKQD